MEVLRSGSVVTLLHVRDSLRTQFMPFRSSRMRIVFAPLLLIASIPALAQSADVLYSQACGPKDANFAVEQVKGQPPASPDPGKALVYVIQKESSRGIF